jgi:nitrate reductase gamma subunit
MAQQSSSHDIARVHRVDDFVTPQDLRDGLVRSDRDAPLVVFSHSAHSSAGVSCEECHHLGVEDFKAPACATCHKGADAVGTMHRSCLGCHEERGEGPTSCNACHTARQTSFAGIVRFELQDFVRGPLFIAAWVVFALGFAWRILQHVRMTRTSSARAMPAARTGAEADREFRGTGRFRRWVRATIFGTNPVMGAVSLVFHLALFLVPLLLPAHNIMFFQSLGVSLPTIPEWLADRLTLGLLVIGGFFLLRRVLLPRVRALTTLRDYLVLVMVAAPLVSAYMAYHQLIDYRTILIVHMLIGEAVIAAIPFSKLGHMPFIIFARFFTAGERAWKPGTRRW